MINTLRNIIHIYVHPFRGDDSHGIKIIAKTAQKIIFDRWNYSNNQVRFFPGKTLVLIHS